MNSTNIARRAISFPNILEGYGLLGPDILFSHGNGLDAEEAKLLKKHDIFISSTPDTEGQMACGEIGCFRDDMQASLGIDCKYISKLHEEIWSKWGIADNAQFCRPCQLTSDVISQMRLALQLVRYTTNKALLDAGKFPANLKGDYGAGLQSGHDPGCKSRSHGRPDRLIGGRKTGRYCDI